MRVVSNSYAIASLLLANAIPVYGVWFWGWNAFALIVLYWLENVIVGVSTLYKMQYSEGGTDTTKFAVTKQDDGGVTITTQDGKTMSIKGFGATPQALANGGKMFYMPFFLFHYGMFTFVHLIFTLVFFFSPDVSPLQILISFISLCLSHYISFQTNYIGKGEYKKAHPGLLLFQPYPRIFVMQFTVILGGMLAMQTGESAFALTLMVVIKTIADLGSHLFEHWRVWSGELAQQEVVN